MMASRDWVTLLRSVVEEMDIDPPRDRESLARWQVFQRTLRVFVLQADRHVRDRAGTQVAQVIDVRQQQEKQDE